LPSVGKYALNGSGIWRYGNWPVSKTGIDGPVRRGERIGQAFRLADDGLGGRYFPAHCFPKTLVLRAPVATLNSFHSGDNQSFVINCQAPRLGAYLVLAKTIRDQIAGGYGVLAAKHEDARSGAAQRDAQQARLST
jgi:hypothetical protein